MKNKIVVFYILLFISPQIFGQASDSSFLMRPDKNKNSTPCPRIYFGISTGVNNANGLLGFNLDVPIISSVSVSAGVGVSPWGNKLYAEGRYYLHPCHRGWAFGGGLTHSSGRTDFKAKLSTVNGKEDVTVDLHQQSNLFLAAYHFWTLGKKHNRFYVSGGYSAPVADISYHEITGDTLTSQGVDRLKRISPGGIMIGSGFSFGM